MRHLFLAVMAVVLPTHAGAMTIECVFDLECYETQPCEMTAFGMYIDIMDGEVPYPVIAETEAETMTGEAFPFGDGLLLRLASEVGAVLLTIDAAGTVRHSIHARDEATMINYTGGCRELI